MTIRLMLKRPDGNTVSWGNYTSVDVALKAGIAAKQKVPELITGQLFVQHQISPLESTLLNISDDTTVNYII